MSQVVAPAGTEADSLPPTSEVLVSAHSAPHSNGRNHVVAGARLPHPHERVVAYASQLGYPDELAVAAALVVRLRSRDLRLYSRVHLEADSAVLWLEASTTADLDALVAHLDALPARAQAAALG